MLEKGKEQGATLIWIHRLCHGAALNPTAETWQITKPQNGLGWKRP